MRKSLAATTSKETRETPVQVQFRQATQEDLSMAREILFNEKMNPLSPMKERLLIAYDKDDMSKASIGFGQIKPLDERGAYYELTSLYILPQYRKQGIGSILVSQLIENHKETKKIGQVYLITLRRIMPFYNQCGFQYVSNNDDIPPPLQIEYSIVSFLSTLLGNEAVCMVLKE